MIPVCTVITWALFGILEIGNLIEEPFTAVTEVGRTVRRDVRSIAQYAIIAQDNKAPSMRVNPRDTDLDLPDGFKKLRKLLATNATKGNATNATWPSQQAAAAAEAAKAGQKEAAKAEKEAAKAEKEAAKAEKEAAK